MDLAPQILTGNVMHKRLFPKVNGFTYGIYYIAFPLSKMDEMDQDWRFGINRAALFGFYEKDHGPRDGSSLETWIRDILSGRGIAADGEIVLICMPRVLGHVFNPVSFWLCYDKAGGLRAVLYEVNNTFGETHSYLCTSIGTIGPNDVLEAEKLFHVSPFLPREGHYKFRLNIKENKVAIWIDYYAADGRKQLITALTGALQPWTRGSLNRVFWRYPLVSLMALTRIHWHAVRLLLKGIPYVPRPQQHKGRISDGTKITKM